MLMGNSFVTTENYNKDEKYTASYKMLKNHEISKIREQYDVIDVSWLSIDNVHYQMGGDKYFDKSNSDNSKTKEEIINSMLVYYLTCQDRAIYKKTDYLCNEREKFCICNTHADDFRKIYNGNYKEGDKFISWFREKKHRF
jgi:hypothetical protein